MISIFTWLNYKNNINFIGINNNFKVMKKKLYNQTIIFKTTKISSNLFMLITH